MREYTRERVEKNKEILKNILNNSLRANAVLA